MKIFYLYFWRDFWYQQVSSRLFPRQRWLTKIIPRQYHDKDYLLEIIVLEILKNYVEAEIGVKELFDEKRWADREKDKFLKRQIKFESELKEHYLLLTKKLPELERDLARECEKLDYVLLAEGVYKKMNSIEILIDNLKSKIMLWTISNRGSLWS